MQWFNNSLKIDFIFSLALLHSLIIIGLTTFFKEQNKQYHLKRLQRKRKPLQIPYNIFKRPYPRVVNEFTNKSLIIKLENIDVNNFSIITEIFWAHTSN